MRHLIALFLAALALAACGRNEAPDEPIHTIDQTAPAAAPDPRLEGCWAGTLTTTVAPRRLVLIVSLDPEAVRMVSPDQGGAAVTLEQVRLDGPRLAAATRLGAFRFDGALAPGGDRLAGDLVQGGLVDRIVFDRAEDGHTAC